MHKNKKKIDQIDISCVIATHNRDNFLKQAIKYGAASLVISHNHPSGDPTPSVDDNILTAEIQSATRTLNIKLVDHIIIGKGEHFSYADEGRLL